MPFKSILKSARKILRKIWQAGRRLFTSEKVDTVLSVASLLFPAAAPVVQLVDQFFDAEEPPEDEKIKDFFRQLLIGLGMDDERVENLDKKVDKAWDRFKKNLKKLDMTLEDLRALSKADKMALSRSVLQCVLREEHEEDSVFPKLTGDKKSTMTLAGNYTANEHLFSKNNPKRDPESLLNHTLELTMVQGKLNDGIDDLKALAQFALIGSLPGREDKLVVTELLAAMVPADEPDATARTYNEWKSDKALRKEVAAFTIRKQIAECNKPIRFFGLDLTSYSNPKDLSQTLINHLVESIVAEHK